MTTAPKTPPSAETVNAVVIERAATGSAFPSRDQIQRAIAWEKQTRPQSPSPMSEYIRCLGAAAEMIEWLAAHSSVEWPYGNQVTIYAKLLAAKPHLNRPDLITAIGVAMQNDQAEPQQPEERP